MSPAAMPTGACVVSRCEAATVFGNVPGVIRTRTGSGSVAESWRGQPCRAEQLCILVRGNSTVRKTFTGIALLASLAFAVITRPASADLTLYPNSPGVTNVIGNTSTSAPGFGTGSFQAPGTNKSEIYILPSSLFTGDVTIKDITSISFWTNKPGSAGGPDWSLYLYTKTTGSGDTGSFYHTRLVAEPLYSNTPSVTPNTWHEWSTNDASNPLRFYDQARDGNIQGTNSDPTLATLQSGPFSWPSGSTYDYSTSNDKILYFSLQTGSQWANGFTGLVDGLTINLTGGRSASVNLEAATPTPEPSTMTLVLSGGVFGLFGLWRQRRRQNLA